MKLFTSWSTLIVMLMVLPFPDSTKHWLGHLDLLVHFGLFGILGGLSYYQFRRRRDDFTILLLSLFLSGIIFLPEFAQGFIADRSFAWLDLISNSLGFLWGIGSKTFGGRLNYLLVSCVLLGSSFGLGIFEKLTYQLTFQEFGLITIGISGLLPLPFLITVYARDTLEASILFTFVYLFFLLVLSGIQPGIGSLLGSLSFICLLFPYAVPRIHSQSILFFVVTMGLTGFSLFLVEILVGTELFITSAGQFGIVSLLVAEFIRLSVLRLHAKEWISW